MALEGLTAAVGTMLQKVFGSRNERLVRAYREVAEQAAAWDDKFSALKDEEFPGQTEEFRRRLKAGETIESLLPEAFALVRVAADRAIGLRPFDVQLIGGQVLFEGKIAEMVTGEGKTLVAVLPNYLRALVGKVHLVTVNDYLVRRDANWMGPVYRLLGFSVGFIQTPMDPAERLPQYACDITYGTNNEFGFDYLRDNMKTSREEQVQGALDYVIVDEVDSVLIDEARTPLIISGPAFDSTDKYAVADRIVRQLRPGSDFEIKEKEHVCPMNERGIKKAEQLVGAGSFYVAGNMEWPHLLEQSLRAHHLYRLDKEYVVQNNLVIIVDEFTGRLMPGRQWSDGLHQAIEAKEGITVKEETQTLATITFQNFFRLYGCLAGMTGTAMTEGEEFYKIYKLEVVAIPTNRPLNRVSHPDVVYMTLKEKHQAIIEEINRLSKRGRPILVGTVSIETSERLSNLLARTHGIEHEVLSAKHHEREAEIVAHAGEQHVDRSGQTCGNVTIATNMAGRGTDIKLAEGVVFKNCHGPWDLEHQERPADFGNKCCIICPEYDGSCRHCFKPKLDPAFPKRGRTECRDDPPCGLHVVGTERHESRRIDNQLRGRSGRQGDPGSSRFFLSLEDDLMRVFAKDWVTNVLKRLGMEEGMALEHDFLSRGIENAQKKVEEHNFSIRKNLLEYDEVMDSQRKVFYGRRQEILEAGNLRPIVWEHITESLQKALDNILRPEYPCECIAEWARRTLETTPKTKALEGRAAEELEIYLKELAADDARTRVEETIGEFYATEGEEEGPADDEDAGPAEVESEPELDCRALAEWARSRLGVNLKERELREMDGDAILEKLQEAAAQRVRGIDCSAALRDFLEEDYAQRTLSGWLRKKFDLDVPLQELRGRPKEAVNQSLLERLAALYDRKEREYPIERAVEECLNPMAGGGAFNYASLARWATWQYGLEVTEDELKLDSFEAIKRHLLELAERSEQTGALAASVTRGLSRYLSSDDAQPTEHNLPAIRGWAAENLGLELTAEELEARTRADLQELLLKRLGESRRNEMNNLERFLLLQVYDTSWKDHLYVMDHLKGSVGMRAYAQVDPKIEYKREGLRQFQQMLEGINDKFTDLFFKARMVQRDALRRIWAGQTAEHEEIVPGLARFEEQRQAALQSLQGQTTEKPKPIVRSAARVGRNEPCPCGSGKKYKKCCGQGK